MNDKNNNFLLKNSSILYSIVFFIIILIIITCLIISNNKNKNEEFDNQTLFSIIEDANNINIKSLEELYKKESLSNNTKSFVGMALAKEYLRQGNYVDSIKIYDFVYNFTKDKFIKELASYNSFRLSLLTYEDEEKILNEYNVLISENNHLKDFVKEQYALYLLEKNKVNEAKIIFNSIEKNDTNQKIFERIELYKDTYKF